MTTYLVGPDARSVVHIFKEWSHHSMGGYCGNSGRVATDEEIATRRLCKYCAKRHKEQDMSDQQQQNPQPEQNPQPQQQPDNPAPVEPAPVDQPATTQEQQDTEG
jgi:hypothetical protein